MATRVFVQVEDLDKQTSYYYPISEDLKAPYLQAVNRSWKVFFTKGAIAVISTAALATGIVLKLEKAQPEEIYLLPLLSGISGILSIAAHKLCTGRSSLETVHEPSAC